MNKINLIKLNSLWTVWKKVKGKDPQISWLVSSLFLQGHVLQLDSQTATESV